MKLKKLFNRKNNESEIKSIRSESGIYKFLDKEGFYIVLFLCVCIVAITAVWVTKTNIDRLAAEDIVFPPTLEQSLDELEKVDEDLLPGVSNETKNTAESSTVVIEQIDEDDDSIPTAAAQNNAVVTPVKQVPQKQEAQPAKKVENPTAVQKTANSEPVQAKIAMSMPLKGKIGMKYASDTLTYSKTLDQFTTHNGLDIIATENTPVMAAMDGEVIEVFVDSRLGLTITLSHTNDMITRYSNLSTDQMVKVGDIVEKGQVISGVGKNALFEIAEEPHLHFEVLVDGENVDPVLYIPVK